MLTGNYAIGDGVEAANVLTAPLLNGSVCAADLAEVQRRRERVARMAQGMQGVIQGNFIARAMRDEEFDLPLPMRFALKVPWLRDIPARLIALGFRRLRLENL